MASGVLPVEGEIEMRDRVEAHVMHIHEWIRPAARDGGYN